MLSEPRIVTRPAEPYAAIRLTVEQPEISQKAPPLIPEIIGWVRKNGRQAGPVFFNYTRMDGLRTDMEVGAPTEGQLKGDGRVATGTLPAGRYLWATYTGHYSGLYAAHEELHRWSREQNLLPDMGERQTLLEIYETDPEGEPDPGKWVTHIAFKLPD